MIKEAPEKSVYEYRKALDDNEIHFKIICRFSTGEVSREVLWHDTWAKVGSNEYI